MATINPYGKDIIKVTTEFEGRPLTLEVNRVGFRTTGSVLVTYGDTVVLGSVQGWFTTGCDGLFPALNRL